MTGIRTRGEAGQQNSEAGRWDLSQQPLFMYRQILDKRYPRTAYPSEIVWKDARRVFSNSKRVRYWLRACGLDEEHSHLFWSHKEEGPSPTRLTFHYGNEAGEVDFVYQYSCDTRHAADHLRDIFINPFDETLVYPSEFVSWQTPQVRSLARAAWNGALDNAQFAILGDALEDAGCEVQRILTHCRTPRTLTCLRCEGEGNILEGLQGQDEEDWITMTCPDCRGHGRKEVDHLKGNWLLSVLLGEE